MTEGGLRCCFHFHLEGSPFYIIINFLTSPLDVSKVLEFCWLTVLRKVEQVSNCQTLEKCLLIQEMGATNPEKVKMVVKNMETFMPKVMISRCLETAEEFLVRLDLHQSTLHCDVYGIDKENKDKIKNLPT